MKLEIVERHPALDIEGAIGRPSKVEIHAENSEEVLVLTMLSNSLFELNRYHESDELRKKFHPTEDVAEITMSEFGRKTLATIHLSISNTYPHHHRLWVDDIAPIHDLLA
ncbi:MAG: hypothetical protein WC657_00720 [Candidatus Paceibacterota bacterium]|jgi:hypothetical protein